MLPKGLSRHGERERQTDRQTETEGERQTDRQRQTERDMTQQDLGVKMSFT